MGFPQFIELDASRGHGPRRGACPSCESWQERKARALSTHCMDAHQLFAHLRWQQAPTAGQAVLPHDTPADRFPLEPIDDKKTDTQNRGIFAKPARPRQADAGIPHDLQDPKFLAATQGIGLNLATHIATQNQAVHSAFRPTDNVGVERPGIAAGSAGQAGEVADLHGSTGGCPDRLRVGWQIRL